MTPEEFLKNLNKAIDQTVEDLKPTMEEAALTAKALLARRVQNQGFGKQYTSRSYLRLRAKRGYELRFVNLTFSGSMFRNWKIPNNYRLGLKVGGSVGGTDVETRNKLRWNKSRYPNFSRIAPDEKDIIVENLVKPRLIEALKKNMFKR